jgi:Ni,Fe-hydrogenase I large subunit
LNRVPTVLSVDDGIRSLESPERIPGVDFNGAPGALEQALIGVPVRSGEKDPVAVQHIVRSFDPSMGCTFP